MSRGVDEHLFGILASHKIPQSINYDVATSKFCVKNGDKLKNYWRLNDVINDSVRSVIHVENDNVSDVYFYPFDDVAGCALIESVCINGNPVDLNSIDGYKDDFKYMPKVRGCFRIPIVTDAPRLEMEVKWKYKSSKDFLMYKS